MNDLKILAIKDILRVSSVEYAKGMTPLSILITGESLNDASQVLVNDLEVPEFVVLSPSRLLAQVPSSERGSNLRKLSVIADRPSVNRKSLLNFEVGKSFKKLRGLERLVQLFCKILIQTPGSDRFNKSLGGDLLSIIGRQVSKGDQKGLQASAVSAISRTREQILAIQAKNSRIPSDERLLSARVGAVGFDPPTTTLSMRVFFSAVSGQAAVANLTF